MFEEESDFDRRKLLCITVLSTLIDLGCKRRTAWQTKSDIELLISELRLIKKDEQYKEDLRFKEGMKTLTLPVLFAYYLSDELNKLMIEDGHQSHFKIFQDIHKLIENLGEDFEAIQKTILAYLVVDLKQDVAFAVQLMLRYINVLKLVHKTYYSIKSILNYKLTSDDFRMKQTTLLLEHIGKKGLKKHCHELWQLQNELVHEGLSFSDGGHYLFELGSAFTITQILSENKLEDIVAWYFCEKLLNHIACFGSHKELGESIESFRKKQYEEFRGLATKHQDIISLYKAIAPILESFKTTQKISSIDVFTWFWDLYHIISAYKHYEPKLKKILADAVTIHIRGDSIAGGYRIKRLVDRWVFRLQKKFEEANLPFKVVIGNFAVSGYKIEDYLRRTSSGKTVIEQELENAPADIELFETGGNDAYAQRSTRKIEKDVREILKFAKQSGVKHIVWGHGLPETFPCSPGYREDYATMWKVIAKEENIKEAEIPLEILKREHIGRDGIHFKDVSDGGKKAEENLQKLADFAFEVLYPEVLLAAKEKFSAKVSLAPVSPRLTLAYETWVAASERQVEKEKENPFLIHSRKP